MSKQQGGGLLGEQARRLVNMAGPYPEAGWCPTAHILWGNLDPSSFLHLGPADGIRRCQRERGSSSSPSPMPLSDRQKTKTKPSGSEG